MICSVCSVMLRGETENQWTGTFDLYLNHHANQHQLSESATLGCSICYSVQSRLSVEERQQEERIKIGSQVQSVKRNAPVDLFTTMKTTEQTSTYFTNASLSESNIDTPPGIYRLDIKLEDERTMGSFILQPLDLGLNLNSMNRQKGRTIKTVLSYHEH